MFDSIDLQEALSDLYDAGVTDDTLPLLYQANAEVYMSVKTPAGLTDRQTIRNIVLQWDTWGSLLASVQVDRIGFLGLVDDIVGITEAGYKAQQLNTFINQKTAENRYNLA